MNRKIKLMQLCIAQQEVIAQQSQQILTMLEEIAQYRNLTEQEELIAEGCRSSVEE